MRFDRASHVCNGKILPLAVGRPQYLAPNFAHKRQHPCVALAFARPPHVCPPPRAAALRTTAFRDACWAMMVSTLSHDVARVEGSRYTACGAQRRYVIDGEHLRCVFTKCRINCARVCVVVRTAQHDDGFYKKACASDRAWTVVEPSEELTPSMSVQLAT